MLTLTNVTVLELCLAYVEVYLLRQVFKKNPALDLRDYHSSGMSWTCLKSNPGSPSLNEERNMVSPSCFAKMIGVHFSADDTSHVEILGRHIVVLHSAKTAMELLDNKSTVY